MSLLLCNTRQTLWLSLKFPQKSAEKQGLLHLGMVAVFQTIPPCWELEGPQATPQQDGAEAAQKQGTELVHLQGAVPMKLTWAWG